MKKIIAMLVLGFLFTSCNAAFEEGATDEIEEVEDNMILGPDEFEIIEIVDDTPERFNLVDDVIDIEVIDDTPERFDLDTTMPIETAMAKIQRITHSLKAVMCRHITLPHGWRI